MKKHTQEEIKQILKNRLNEDVESMVLRKLNEGFLYSYSGRKFAQFLRKVFNRLEDSGLCEPISLHGVVSDPGNDENFPIVDIVVVPLVSKEKFLSILKREMQSGFDSHGWFLGGVKSFSEDGKKKIGLSFEVKYPIEDKNIDKKSKQTIKRHKKFYHVAFEKNEKSILKNGLIPKITNRPDFLYPERIYLFGKEDLAEIFANYHFKNPTAQEHMLNATMVKIGNTGSIANLKFQTHLAKIVVFEVDLLKMMKDGKLVRLYHDTRSIDLNHPNEVSAAYFTYNQIPSQYLTVRYRLEPERS